MILIQDGSQPPNIDKPLRIIGDPYKVQVLLMHIAEYFCYEGGILCSQITLQL